MSYEKAADAAKFIRSRFDGAISTAVVLGSGLGAFGDEIDDATRITFEEIPGFARSTVAGHAGEIVIGRIGDATVAVQKGRFHYYEGYDMDLVMLPVRTFGLLGVKNVILTNAVGSLDPDLQPGRLMMISDHLNCFGINPLRGPNDERFGPRFPDMTEVYDRELQDLAEEAAHQLAGDRVKNGIDAEEQDILARGIYCGLSGPTYETPAEIRMYRQLGADVVGMSTVPEAIAARHMGLRVLGISCVTNLAAGMSDGVIDHADVMDTGASVAEIFKDLLRRILVRLG